MSGSAYDLEYRTYLVRNRARFVEAETRVEMAGETTSVPTVGTCRSGRYTPASYASRSKFHSGFGML